MLMQAKQKPWNLEVDSIPARLPLDTHEAIPKWTAPRRSESVGAYSGSKRLESDYKVLGFV